MSRMSSERSMTLTPWPRGEARALLVSRSRPPIGAGAGFGQGAGSSVKVIGIIGGGHAELRTQNSEFRRRRRSRRLTKMTQIRGQNSESNLNIHSRCGVVAENIHDADGDGVFLAGFK